MVGVLALQGGFAAHAGALAQLGHDVREVRSVEALEGLDGLVLPGGESTTLLHHLEDGSRGREMASALDGFVRSGRPVLATCAGLILAARRVAGPEQRSFGWLDVSVTRNAWGRQLDSFEARSDGPLALPLLFIRAPRIERCGEEVEILATYRDEPVLVRQRQLYGASFHPELTQDPRVHRMVFGEARVDLPTPELSARCPPLRSSGRTARASPSRS